MRSAWGDQHSAHVSGERIYGCFELSLHSAGSDPFFDQGFCLRARQRGTNSPAIVSNSIHVG